MENKKLVSKRLAAFTEKLHERVLKQQGGFFDTLGTRAKEQKSSEEEEQQQAIKKESDTSIAENLREMLDHSSQPIKRHFSKFINR